MIGFSSFIPKKTVAKAALVTTPATVPSTIAGVYSESSERVAASLVESNERLIQSQEEGVQLIKHKNKAVGDKKVSRERFSNIQQARRNVIENKRWQLEGLKREIAISEHSINELKSEEYQLSDENEQIRSILRQKNNCLAWLKNKRVIPECEVFLKKKRAG